MRLSNDGYKFPEVGTIFECEPSDITFDPDKNTYYINLIYSKMDLDWKVGHNNKGLKCMFGKEFHIFLKDKRVKKFKILHIAKNKKCVICEPLELV